MRCEDFARAPICRRHQLAVSFITSMFTIDDVLELAILGAYSQVAPIVHK